VVIFETLEQESEKKENGIEKRVYIFLCIPNSVLESHPDSRFWVQTFLRFYFVNSKIKQKYLFLVFQCFLTFLFCFKYFDYFVVVFVQLCKRDVFTPHHRRRALEQKCRAC
jgi:hypothetical protein